MSKRRFHKLGRLASVDLRDHQHPMPLVRRLSGVTSRTWNTAPALDQGNTSQCVAFAWTQFLSAGPVTNRRLPFLPAELYREAQNNDEWPGAEPDYEGTSVRAGAKVLQGRGYLSEYVWAFNSATAANWILSRGPVVAGTIWANDMFDVDAKGVVHVGGDVVGGHAYALIGCNLKARCPDGSTGAMRIQNSWGPSWGQSGKAWISFKDFDVLMAEDGECCTATEVKQPKVQP
jgi:hypothetical protein